VRLFRPSLLVFALAVLASLSIHLPVYTVLGELAEILNQRAAKPDAAPAGPIEFEVVEQEAQATASSEPPPVEDPKKPDEVERDKEKQAKPQTPPKPERDHAKAAAPKPKPEPIPIEVVPKPVPMPTEPVPSKHAITQKSDDPNVPAPDNPRFVAEENRRVEEETIASARTTAELDEQPESASRARPAEDLPGNAEQEDVQQLQDVRGEDRRNPTAEEAREKPRAPSEVGRGQERAPAVAQAPAQGGSDSRDQQASRELEAGSPQQGGEPDTVVLNDGTGSIRIRKTPQGLGPGQNGGEARPGASSPSERQAGARKGGGANLNLSWSQFESTFGEDELRAQREAYLEQRKTQARGGRSQEQWKKFRAAVENYVDKVRPGNQTALNAAASPFAAYLAAVHRNIHREFALGFLRSLPLLGGPFADPTLRTRLELVINQDGSLHDLGVVQTSGFTPYDLGAWNAVTKAAPFPEAPKKILSGDGRVYIVWDFYNNERQCGTFNAEPKILKFPQSTPPAAPGPMHDTGDVPRDGKLGWLEHESHDLAPGDGHAHEPVSRPVVTAQQP
jgi:TonB family protein